jgi:hypothetical protein
MNGMAVTVDGSDEMEQDFRRAMAALTEQAVTEGLEMAVVEALFPLFMPGIGPDDGEDHPL